MDRIKECACFPSFNTPARRIPDPFDRLIKVKGMQVAPAGALTIIDLCCPLADVLELQSWRAFC